MTITAIFTNKGGVGKTVATACLANSIAATGKSVAVVDLDPQSNLSHLLLGQEHDRRATTVDDIMAPVVRGDGTIKSIGLDRSEGFGVDVLSCTPRLALIEDFLAREWRDACAAEPRGVNATLAIHSALSDLADRYDEVLVDCGPMLGSLTRAGLIAADRYVSPVTRDSFSVIAIENAGEWIRSWQKHWDRIPLISSVTRSQPIAVPDVASFAGYFTTGANGPGRSSEIEAELAAAAAQVSPDGQLLGDIPYSTSIWAVRKNHLPYSALNADHGLVGAQFADRWSSECAWAELAKTLVEPAEPAISTPSM